MKAKRPRKQSLVKLVLDGHIYVVEKVGKDTIKTEIDGKVVLKILEQVIIKGITQMVE